MKYDDKYHGVEYFHIVQNGKVLFMIEPKDINGKTKLEVQEIVGAALGEGHKRYSMKFKGDPKVYTAKIRAVDREAILDKTKKKSSQDPELQKIDPELFNKLDELKNSVIDKSNNAGGVPFQDVLSLLRETNKVKDELFQMRINELSAQIAHLNNQNNSPSYMDLMALIVLKKMGIDMPDTKLPGQKNLVIEPQTPKNTTSAEILSNGNRIPKKLNDALNKYDFSKLSVQQLENITNNLPTLIDNLK